MTKLVAISVALFVACGGSQDTASTDPIGDTPIADEPVADEPVADEPVADEPAPPAEETTKHVSIDDVQWEALDPEAGDKGPMAGQLWGDKAEGASWFLVKAPAKFPGAPHVHTNDYRGVVISGEIHNDKAKVKKKTYMKAGSFWSEPGGRAHITSCKTECMALVSFDGAFDFLPATETGDSPSGMTGANTLAASRKWMNPPGTPEGQDSPVKLSMAWGDPTDGEPNAFFVKIPAGVDVGMHKHTSDYHAVVIQGRQRHWEPGGDVVVSTPGSYFWQKGGTPHNDGCEAGADCVIYVTMEGVTDMTPVAAK